MCNHPTALCNLGILKEGDPSATLSAVRTVMRSVGRPLCLGQAQNGRFASHEPETSAEFGDPRNEPTRTFECRMVNSS